MIVYISVITGINPRAFLELLFENWYLIHTRGRVCKNRLLKTCLCLPTYLPIYLSTESEHGSHWEWTDEGTFNRWMNCVFVRGVRWLSRMRRAEESAS